MGNTLKARGKAAQWGVPPPMAIKTDFPRRDAGVADAWGSEREGVWTGAQGYAFRIKVCKWRGPYAVGQRQRKH